MTAPPRYAIYFLPAAGSLLARQGAAWVGRDVLTGRAVEQHRPASIDAADFRDATESARRYGFHATLKAPIRLIAGVSETDLRDAAQAFAADTPAFPLGRLSPKWIGPFLALTPDSADPDHMNALKDWAFAIVRGFEPFRAEMPEVEFRRRAEGLDERQRQLLERWGYPYVCDQFRFHMTLSAPVAEDTRPAWRAAACDWFETAMAEDVMIDAVSIAVERDPPGPFVELARFPLRT